MMFNINLSHVVEASRSNILLSLSSDSALELIARRWETLPFGVTPKVY